MSRRFKQEGERVGALLSYHDGKAELLGYGVYTGWSDGSPEDGCIYKIGPKIVLDNGDVVYGCECWWDDEKTVKEMVAKATEVINVSIVDQRKIWEQKEEATNGN